MKINLIWLSLGSLALAAVSGTAFGGTDSLESATPPATAAASLPSTQKAAEPPNSQLTLTVVGPLGAQYHLVYAAGQGWQFVDVPSRSAIVKVKSDGTVAPLAAATSGEIRPQTVFIDGPTGYTFVWAEGGWKFVGNIATAER